MFEFLIFICGFIIALIVVRIIPKNEKIPTREEFHSKYDAIMNHREQLVKQHGPITDRIKTDPAFAAQEFHYLIDGMTTGTAQERVFFLLNVVEKYECMNPDLIAYLKSSVDSSEVNAYECIKENLYNVWHGKEELKEFK